ncbi:putative ribosome biogenesis protein [Smittium mucronatum]|uniref:Putative ribosome biogenesis protein n=1 Tax=Smittium mucronatum TaxID=133383 RepID=A0A1R0GLD8_9FUNG|nr:putative ribosome biogenesis protein C8F11.04 [Smittium mucronatum]OLY80887.1 putative ribosome biogenesis protein [Smittium mucronatum]
MVDDRVIPILPKLLGSKFFSKKKQPVIVNLTKPDLAHELTKALNSTYFFSATGSSLSVKIGVSNLSTDQLSQNIIHALPFIVDRIPKKALNIKYLGIKSPNSVALPIYTNADSVKKRKSADPSPPQSLPTFTPTSTSTPASDSSQPIKELVSKSPKKPRTSKTPQKKIIENTKLEK